MTELLSPVHRFMRFLGFYNFLFEYQIHKTDGCSLSSLQQLLHRLKLACFMGIAVFALLLCGRHFWLHISSLPTAYNKYGAFHPNFAGTLLGTFDWVLAIGNLLYFAIRRRAHLEMLLAMDEVSSANGITCRAREWKIVVGTLRVRMFFLAMALFFCTTLVYAVHSEFSFTTIISIHKWTLLVSPLHMLWNVLPICYFLLCTSLFNQFDEKCYMTIDGGTEQIEDNENSDSPLAMELSSRIFNAKRAFFQPLLYFWLFWSAFVCLTSVYVLVQYPKLFEQAETIPAVFEHRFRVGLVRSKIGWFVLQNLIALFHLYAIWMNINKK